MARYIILTATQANAVRGKTLNGSALDPIAIRGGPEAGRFALPARVLDDLDHGNRKVALAARRTVELDEATAFQPIPED